MYPVTLSFLAIHCYTQSPTTSWLFTATLNHPLLPGYIHTWVVSWPGWLGSCYTLDHIRVFHHQISTWNTCKERWSHNCKHTYSIAFLYQWKHNRYKAQSICIIYHGTWVSVNSGWRIKLHYLTCKRSEAWQSRLQMYTVLHFFLSMETNRCRVFTIYVGISFSGYILNSTQNCLILPKRHVPACTISPKGVCTRMVS